MNIGPFKQNFGSDISMVATSGLNLFHKKGTLAKKE